MKTYTLSNQFIQIKVKEIGAELVSLLDLTTSVEYMWSGDSKYWGRVSPILFPFVGRLKDASYRLENKTYTQIPPHGFARDMTFSKLEQTETELWLRLEDNEDSYKIYPFHFALDLGYELHERTVFVKWRVTNTDTKPIHFSIGGHPAFLCPNAISDEDAQYKKEDYYLDFHTSSESILSSKINLETGLVIPPKDEIFLSNGKINARDTLFDEDALVIENNQTNKISLLLPNKTPYLTVSFDAPLVGVWSPTKKNAPFICIEPWYGRCDSEEFDGDLQDRIYGNTLEQNQIFQKEYTITI